MAEAFDTLGRRVAVPYDGEAEADKIYRLALDGSRLASGTYVVRIRGERFATAARLALGEPPSPPPLVPRSTS
jgi:hypothetical protein